MPLINRGTALGLLALGLAAGGRVSAQARDPRAAIFIGRGCTECHAISAFHVKATHDVGPDLTLAYGDVVNRYGVSLEAFLYEPRGLFACTWSVKTRLNSSTPSSTCTEAQASRTAWTK